MFNSEFAENINALPEGTPFNAAGYDRIVIVVNNLAADTDYQLTVTQGKGSGMTDEKALNFTKFAVKDQVAGTDGSDPKWTWITQAASNTLTRAVTGASALCVVEVRDRMLDINNGFTHVQVANAGVTPGRVTVFGVAARNSGTNLPSAV